MSYFFLFSYVLFVFFLGYYLMSSLQWYSYKIKRILFHFTKPWWHFFFFILPIVFYYSLDNYFWFYFYFIYILTFYFWYKKLDKPLVFTARIKRFFLFLILVVISWMIICKMFIKCHIIGIFTPLFISYFVSLIVEKMIFEKYKNMAKNKIESLKDLRIIAITASFGKTSIKNFLYHLLSKDNKVYMTPRSVNTLGGIIKDINECLEVDNDFYIVEAGAREKGDIHEISSFINPQYIIAGQIGAQHIEYFKNLENIRNTKIEIINSSRLEFGLVHESLNIKPSNNLEIFSEDFVKNIKATLDGLEFEISIDGVWYKIETSLLGRFHVTNLIASIIMANKLGVCMNDIVKLCKKIKQTTHRLSRIDAGGKLILDDSFNGNLSGMLASYELCNLYDGRKIIITPGIVESSKNDNEILAKKINEVFDLIIITSHLNLNIFRENIDNNKIIHLENKSFLEKVLIEKTKSGDLIIFSNDAPTYL